MFENRPIGILRFLHFRKRAFTFFFSTQLSKVVSISSVLNPSKCVHNFALVLHLHILLRVVIICFIAIVDYLFVTELPIA